MAAAISNAAGQYLTFTLAQELFGVDIHAVREIIEYGRLTSVPMMPPSILGVINLRGAVVPVIDLGLRFGGKATVIGPRTCIVILEIASRDGLRVIGMVVDAVNEVLELGSGQIEPPPSFGNRIRADFIRGMGKLDDRLVVLLDVGRVLSDDEIALLEQAGAHATTAQESP
ncbi:chemotaxis protein CheW [Ectopseudomonas mendocina]|jgi:purine-binding chemotaxis protein CheW|uniref:CheW-like protein n=2 Tax=Ectopseudomonas mendocina TaxID=300 RepID=A0A379IPD4_ECTME|nr:chemotaxis protein CheW [Pseudomonas mendocina]ALN17454.1 chemotaxis protein CheW [Pseudomonas mendocina S5.2]KES01735.1 chemotaxis protein CheW [Pseudomonas mendocina]MDF2075589.1 chemotaxis protein CheW [Pseudomonas mendocina]SUD38125.1 CheW-like protein [Pseudomonas mendocina]VEE17760.1 CheW-like protein [Pseudomonas mendocina]